MDDASNPDALDPSSTDAIHQQLLQAARPELGSALEGLRARMLATAGGLAPRTVGRYRLGRVLGSGSFGTVHEAEDPELDRRVAVKLLRVRSEKEAARVVREARLLATLSHPNVVQVFEVGTTDDGRSPYVVMELVEGPTLRQWMTDGSHAWREVVEVVLQAARGLWAAHQAGIIHRDLKPENVLMGRDGRPRVIDFGLARALGGSEEASSEATLRSEADAPSVHAGSGRGSPQLTATGQVMGTPAYMAPEVFAGEHTPLSDQYALCLTLYEALFGQRPFAADSPRELAEQLHEKEAELPADRRGVPRHLSAIVLRGLRRSPRERFGDLGRLVEALERSLRPRRWALAVAGVAVLGAGGVLLASLRPAPEPVAADQAPAVEPVVDPRQSAEIAAITPELERLRVLVATAKLDAAQELSASLLERAEALGHTPTSAEAWLLRGQVLVSATDYEHAVPVLEKAFLLAQQADVPLVAAHAASELVGVRGYIADDYALAHEWQDHADGAFQRAGLDPREHAPYVFGVAGLMSREGDRAGAIARLQEGVAMAERGPQARASGHALLLKALGREQFFAGQREAGLGRVQQAAAIYAEHDGVRSFTHAATLDNVGVFLSILGRPQEALEYCRQALEIREAILEPEHIDLARSYGNMGMVLGQLGRHDEAFAHLDRSMTLFVARLGPGNAAVAENHALRAAIHASRGPEGREAALRNYEQAARIFDGAGIIYVKKAERARQAIRDLGGTPPPAPSIAIPP